MLEILKKPLADLSEQDINDLIELEVRENQYIEFKRSLSSSKGKNDPDSATEKLTDKAKHILLEEVTAFANAHGGVLILGIKESMSSAHLGKATSINTIPACEVLAQKLRMVFRDCVEPLIPNLEIHPISIDGDRGVIVFRINRSALATHRVKPTLKVPVRRDDRNETMSMREIQERIVNESMRRDRNELASKKRKDRFSGEFNQLDSSEHAIGVRVTGMPLGDPIDLGPVYENGGHLKSVFSFPKLAVLMSSNGNLISPERGAQFHWRPLIRGARANDFDADPNRSHHYQYYREIYQNGLVEIGFLVNANIFEEHDNAYLLD